MLQQLLETNTGGTDVGWVNGSVYFRALIGSSHDPCKTEMLTSPLSPFPSNMLPVSGNGTTYPPACAINLGVILFLAFSPNPTSNLSANPHGSTSKIKPKPDYFHNLCGHSNLPSPHLGTTATASHLGSLLLFFPSLIQSPQCLLQQFIRSYHFPAQIPPMTSYCISMKSKVLAMVESPTRSGPACLSSLFSTILLCSMAVLMFLNRVRW